MTKQDYMLQFFKKLKPWLEVVWRKLGQVLTKTFVIICISLSSAKVFLQLEHPIDLLLSIYIYIYIYIF